MTSAKSRSGFIAVAALLGVAACSSSGTPTTQAGSSGSPSGAGSTAAQGTAGSSTSGTPGAASGVAGGGGQAGSTGQGGAAAAGSSGAGSVAGSSGSNGAATSGAGDDGGGASSTGDDGGASAADAGPVRPINVTVGPAFETTFNGQPLSVNLSKPIMGKLVLLLGGICTGVGAGGFESFIKEYGFHVFGPSTQTCVNSAPQMYKDIIATTPDDPDANRQVGDARMDLWDGMNRVTWVTVAPGTSILDETLAAIKYGMMVNAAGDWGYFLNADGTLRTSDVWVVGYSWGSQSWAMISSYVAFGKVITTSGPQDEGFPNATWITHPSATPGDAKYMLVGFDSAYPSTNTNDSEVMGMVTTVTMAGWPGTPTNVLPNGMGTYTSAQHLFAMIGSNGQSPGGHTVFCNDNPANGWIPLCQYVVGGK